VINGFTYRRCCSSSIVPFFRDTRTKVENLALINKRAEFLTCELKTRREGTIIVTHDAPGRHDQRGNDRRQLHTASRESRESIDERITVARSRRRSTLREREFLSPRSRHVRRVLARAAKKMRETARERSRGDFGTSRDATRCAADVR